MKKIKRKRLCEIELPNSIKTNTFLSILATINEEGNIIAKDLEILDLINNHFGTVFTSKNLKMKLDEFMTAKGEIYIHGNSNNGLFISITFIVLDTWKF